MLLENACESRDVDLEAVVRVLRVIDVFIELNVAANPKQCHVNQVNLRSFQQNLKRKACLVAIIPCDTSMSVGTNPVARFTFPRQSEGEKLRMVRPEGFEPPALGFEARCSIQLSYRRPAARIARPERVLKGEERRRRRQLAAPGAPCRPRAPLRLPAVARAGS